MTARKGESATGERERDGALSVTFHPIGRVENGLPLGTPGDTLKAAQSRIILEPDFTPGLDQLEKEPRVLVVRGLDAVDGTPVLDLKPA